MRANGTCRSCGAAVIWVVTEAGKPMPVDATPREWPAGNLELRVDGRVIRSRVVKDRTDDGNMYLSHFASCPNAKKHRKLDADGKPAR